ncbi:AgmX/PglI C-terminal domain-containing protein [Pseudenhygromyxa sp. WMMC2535]|uniref:AgmX/PglI C-terminal domain-containing protein n=1 Tax=Pseudenhygromyxa sp. WMMC2535 TaxID=2712867 RepID=UPI0015553AAA|nr:AgmX/PglI C-terminal domain-containing protein [Pseudenhygromyxa sp. WMMC2535]NVB36505.1 AgmX/PglI C-terminal domain-containing protein [Pseudenhygromyxa sp. WMMC2535]
MRERGARGGTQRGSWRCLAAMIGLAPLACARVNSLSDSESTAPEAPTAEPETAAGEQPPALEREEIRVVVRAKITQVRGCFDAGLAEAPGLGGRVVLGFTIGARGRAEDVAVIEHALTSELDAGATERAAGIVSACLIEALSRWQFPLPRRGEAVRVAYPFVFTAEDTLRAAGLPRVQGTVSPAAVGAVFDARADELAACLRADQDQAPDPAGSASLGVAFTIDEGGRVTAISRYAGSLPAAAERCMLAAIAGWSFPPAAAGDTARVNHDLRW